MIGLIRFYLLNNVMSFLTAILWWVITGSIVMKPLDYGFEYNQVEQVSTQQIYHSGFSSGDQRQAMIQKAYDLWWMDFVTMIECESWFNPNARGDSWKSVGLCQMNTRWHKIPQEYYNSWEYQIDYCYQKRKGWTRFYWPQRKINGQLCKDYVKNRFIIK